VVMGGKSQHCVVGGTLVKDETSQGVLNYAFIQSGETPITKVRRKEKRRRRWRG